MPRDYKRVLLAESQARARAVSRPSPSWSVPPAGKSRGQGHGLSRDQAQEVADAPGRRASARLARDLSALPGDELKKQARAVHGLRHPVLPPGLPARQHHPGLERPRLSRALAATRSIVCTPPTTSRSSRARLCPAPCEGVVRARDQRRSGDDQGRRGHDHRSRVRRGMGRARAAGRRAPARRSRSLAPARPGSRPPSSSTAPATW